MRYSAAQWYWIVGNRAAPTNIFSAPAGAYVAASDAGYTAFLAGGNTPTVGSGAAGITDGELADVMAKAKLNALALAAGATDWGGVPAADVVTAVSAAGCALTSAGTPALDATYELSGTEWQDMRDEAQFISTFDAFSNGGGSLVWAARSGAVTFASTAQFLSVVKGLATYLSAWKVWAAAGMTGTAPGFGAASIA